MSSGNAQLFSGLIRGKRPDEEWVWDLRIEKGVLQRVSQADMAQPPDLGGEDFVLAPGLVDIQVNGAAGVDLLASDLSVEGIAAITNYLADYGVAWWIPTLITASEAMVKQGLEMLVKARRIPEIAAAIPGFHLEGPHISPEDGPRGAHPKEFVCAPDWDRFERLQAIAEGAIRYVTLSPEWPEAPDFIARLKASGVVASLGHHQADAAAIDRAAAAGATLCTHLGNGAAPMMHRHKNPLWPQLADDRLTASIISDGHHLPDAAMKSFVRAKEPKRIVLVSDCVYLAGMKPGVYEIFGARVELNAAGRVSLADTELLAGSACRLADCVSHVIQQGIMTPEQAMASATSIPATVLGLESCGRFPQSDDVVSLSLFKVAHGALAYSGMSIIQGRLRGQ